MTVSLGANLDGDGVRFRVWAPAARTVELVLFEDGRPAARHRLDLATDGYHEARIAGIGAGARYAFSVDGGEPRPDPASRSQPDGVHGPSEVVDPRAFAWSDADWRGVPPDDLVIYELHVGAATAPGTFEALIPHLDDLRELGVTAIEIMPVADFPGARNWGYDGVSLFAPSRAYGGPEGLRRLVDAAHGRGLAVILDVVYNHLGPDGNYLRVFSTAYFTDRHHTPWGEALNFDGPQSAAVRSFFISNALHWAHEYHVDGLRLDATHAIPDDSPTHIVAEIAQAVRRSLGEGRRFAIIAEHEHNDPAVVSPRGWGLDGMWSDDFHHQVRVALTGEQEGYYALYRGTAEDLAATLRHGWFHDAAPEHLAARLIDVTSEQVAPTQLVHCIQNHDQVGNRPTGDRLNHVVSLESYRAASTLLLLSPYLPLIWMGQEWAASTPFLFFTDHNPELGRLVTEGRRREFAGFAGFSGEQVPDPQAEATFLGSKLRWEERRALPHRGVLQLYHDLLDLRWRLRALRAHERGTFAAAALGDRAVALRRTSPGGGPPVLVVANLGNAAELDLTAAAETQPARGGRWSLLLSSNDTRYGGRDTCLLEGRRALFHGPGALVLGGDDA